MVDEFGNLGYFGTAGYTGRISTGGRRLNIVWTRPGPAQLKTEQRRFVQIESQLYDVADLSSLITRLPESPFQTAWFPREEEPSPVAGPRLTPLPLPAGNDLPVLVQDFSLDESVRLYRRDRL